jgi:hypothetical protein
MDNRNTMPIINIDTAGRIIAVLKPTFDSHDFITLFILINTVEYLELLKRYHSVETAHQQVGQFLINNAIQLGIRKVGVVESENVFGNITQCALWERR